MLEGLRTTLLLAHGLTGRQDVPIPTWLFLWGATVVLIVSFVALATLWPKPRLQGDSWRPLPDRLNRVVASRAVAVLCGAIGVFLLGLVFVAGFRGSANSAENFAPTFVYITFWLGLLPLSLLLGDVFRAFNPWRAVGRAVSWIASSASGGPLPAPFEYPRRLGRWPAVAGILAFGWLELAANGGEQPRTIAVAVSIYSAITWAGMALYGVDAWANRGETFSVYFNLIARLSPFERRGDRIGVQRPLSGLAHWEPAPGSVVFVCSLIGVVTFDGFSSGPTFNDWIPTFQDGLESIGFSAVNALEVTFGVGMLVTVAVITGFYLLGAWGRRASAVASASAARASVRPLARADRARLRARPLRQLLRLPGAGHHPPCLRPARRGNRLLRQRRPRGRLHRDLDDLHLVLPGRRGRRRPRLRADPRP